MRVHPLIVVIVAAVCGQAAQVDAGARRSLPPPTAEELPGTVETNAAKAYRVLWAQIESEDGFAGYELVHRVRNAPEEYSDYLPQVVRATQAPSCDWGIEPVFEAIIPHMPAIDGFRVLLDSTASRAIERGDLEGSVEAVESLIRLAEHASRGHTAYEQITAIRTLRIAVERTDDLVDASLLDRGRAAELADLLAPFATEDPLSDREGLETHRDSIVQALMTGWYVPDPETGEYAVPFDGRAPTAGERESAAIAVRESYDQLINGWLRDNFDAGFDAASQTLAGDPFAFQLFRISLRSLGRMHAESVELRDRLHETVQTLEQIATEADD